MNPLTNGLTGCIQMLLEGLHQLTEVFLNDQRHLNERHVELVDKVHRSLGQRDQTVHRLV